MTWAKILQFVTQALAALFDYMRNRQLIDAGRAEQAADNAQANQKARHEADAVNQRVDNASDAELERLRDEWTRK